MPSEAQQQEDFLYRVHSAFCRGRLGAEAMPDYNAAEICAHVLGVERVSHPVPNVTEVAHMVSDLLSLPDLAVPPATPATPTKTAPRCLSPRVVALLVDVGLDPD